MDSIHLIGAEEVSSAGRNISAAADRFSSAANNFDDAARRLCERFDEAITAMNRLAEALEKTATPPDNPGCPATNGGPCATPEACPDVGCTRGEGVIRQPSREPCGACNDEQGCDPAEPNCERISKRTGLTKSEHCYANRRVPCSDPELCDDVGCIRGSPPIGSR